jgi:tetratricopeptide (TPR) repeat protein
MNITTLLRLGKYSEAIDIIDEQINNGDSQNTLLFQKALALYYLKEYSEAEIIYENLFEKNKNSGDFLNSMAQVAIAQNKIQKSINLLETAFEKGNNQSIYDIIKIIFERKGICDYENCTDCCCSNVLVKGIDGKYVENQVGFEKMMANPYENQGWERIGENDNGEWIFACKHLDEKNVCKIYENRPQICKDYPSGILSLKKVCTYHFDLISELPKFQSLTTFAVIIDVLEAYHYQEEKKILVEFNFHLYQT